MIKNLFLVIILFFIGCKLKNLNIIKNNKIIHDAFVSYEFDLKVNDIEFKNDIIQHKIDEAKKAKIDYYFFTDSIRINDVDGKTIFIPSQIKKLVNRKNWQMEHYESINYNSITKNWNITYDIKVDKNDKIKILGLQGYKVIIRENYSTPSGINVENYSELYVSDNYNIPFNKYEFLKLRRNIDYIGLILQLKRYNSESKKSYNLYTLSNFNLEKQDKELIKISNLKKIEK